MAGGPHIEINPKVLGGKPVIRGTRISVELILRAMAEGAAVGDLLSSYPHLTEAGIRAAIAYAADSISAEETVAVAMPAASPRKARR